MPLIPLPLPSPSGLEILIGLRQGKIVKSTQGLTTIKVLTLDPNGISNVLEVDPQSSQKHTYVFSDRRIYDVFRTNKTQGRYILQ